jgi:predicted TIM-barrel fold metal-dependent hydrolase
VGGSGSRSHHPADHPPLWDPEAAAAEIYRCAAKGAKPIAFPEYTVGLGLPSFYTDRWDRAFRAAEETNLPLCMQQTKKTSNPFPVARIRSI